MKTQLDRPRLREIFKDWLSTRPHVVIEVSKAGPFDWAFFRVRLKESELGSMFDIDSDDDEPAVIAKLNRAYALAPEEEP
jgi:hypothetical protein